MSATTTKPKIEDLDLELLGRFDFQPDRLKQVKAGGLSLSGDCACTAACTGGDSPCPHPGSEANSCLTSKCHPC